MTISKAARVIPYQPRSAPQRGSMRSQNPERARSEQATASFIEQTEVCREQARDAANLKRLGAAMGLFATAATLCRHALTLETEATATRAISELLQQIELEAAAYYELARALQKAPTHA